GEKEPSKSLAAGKAKREAKGKAVTVAATVRDGLRAFYSDKNVPFACKKYR
ncbi:hypothetical protein L195_g064427, partial [Trifolium pratense]